MTTGLGGASLRRPHGGWEDVVFSIHERTHHRLCDGGSAVIDCTVVQVDDVEDVFEGLRARRRWFQRQFAQRERVP